MIIKTGSDFSGVGYDINEAYNLYASGKSLSDVAGVFKTTRIYLCKVGSQFSGVGAFDMALKRLNIDFENVYQAEWDKYARQTYLLNNEAPMWYVYDVYDTPIDDIPQLDIAMFSPPCQSFSLAGKRQGENSDKGILFYESHRFIQKNKPRYFIFENVKGLLSDDGGKTFQRWIDFLGGKSANGNPVIFPHEESVPYHVYYQVMNAKHYGVPQNRERIFIIGIRDDTDNEFSFPKPFHLVKRLKDVLESEVDEKYFLSDRMLTWIDKHREKRSSSGKYPFTEEDDYAGCITARYNKKGAEDIFIGAIRGRGNDNEQTLEMNDSGLCNSLTTVQKDNVVVIPANNSKGYDIAEAEEEEYSINFSNPNSETRRGRVGHGVAQTLDTACNQGVLVGVTINERIAGWHENENVIGAHQGDLKRSSVSEHIYHKEGGVCTTIQTAHVPKLIQQRIRRLTPRECARLMDFPETMKFDVSDSQIYKQMGNSIVVSCLVEIISKLNL
jgi:DNA (cytosine-5)-methyltransferase 1